MKFDFTSILDRKGFDSIAVELPGSGVGTGLGAVKIKDGCSVIPMWVADMNFPTVPSIPQAVSARALHPSYGYFSPRKEYFDSIINWQAKRNGVTGLTAECIGYQNGVLGGVISALGAFCAPGEPVLLHSPTYIGFTHCLEDNGYRIVLSPLKKDGEGIWRMDLADMEEKIKANKIHAAVFCSPHNPAGRVWEKAELEAVMELYRKYDVTVISDEIWSDLTMPGHQHIPTQSVSEDARMRTVALYAPSKTFNLAGLIGSYHIIYNPTLRDQVLRRGGRTHYNAMNVLSMHALIAAYTQDGMDWVDELREVLRDNLDYAVRYISAHFPGVKVDMPEGTYMLFLDCTDWCAAHASDCDALLAKGYEVGVIWQDGRPFHGPCHIRMNLALPHSLVVEAFDRLDKHVFNLGK